jgi:hypothetical protein
MRSHTPHELAKVELREGERAPDRLDVRFGERRFAWGVPEKEFEVILN